MQFHQAHPPTNPELSPRGSKFDGSTLPKGAEIAIGPTNSGAILWSRFSLDAEARSSGDNAEMPRKRVAHLIDSLSPEEHQALESLIRQFKSQRKKPAETATPNRRFPFGAGAGNFL
jgi:hypothetical protein